MRAGALVCLVLLFGGGAAEAASVGENSTGDGQAFEAVERGRYLATVGDCAACHTAPGGKPYAGGRAIETPFGTLLAPNLTPDRDTGIGAWSDEEFLQALQQGRRRGGAHLYPAMPYPYYTRATGEDLLAIRAFLRTLEPVHNQVVANQLPFPFDMRASMAAWNELFFTPGTFKPVAGKSDEWNQGAYLVEGLAHCGACHTAKNMLGGDKTSQALQGGLLQGWYSPDVTGDQSTGLGSWSVDEVVTYLKSGHNQTSAATGPMSEVIADSTSHMSDADLHAIAVYLKDLPPQGNAPRPATIDDRTMRVGEAIYTDNCAACHTGAGTGIPNLFPALKGNPSVQSRDATTLIRVVLQGTQSVATDLAPTGPAMPALSWKLSDEQIAAVITYIRNKWGNASSVVSASDVKSQRQRLSAAVP